MIEILLVALGGAIGSVARYFAGAWFQNIQGLSYFPYPTLSVNVIGSFLIGLIMAPTFAGIGDIAHNTRIFLIVGILGGFTTFSAFSGEVLYAFVQQNYQKAFLIFILNNFLGFFAAWIGFAISLKISQ